MSQEPAKAVNLTCFNFIPDHCSYEDNINRIGLIIECLACKKFMCSCPERQENGDWKCGPFKTYKENIAYVAGKQAALMSRSDEKCEGVLIFSAGMGEVNGKPGFVPNEPARMHCSGCGGSSGDRQGQQEAALREALKRLLTAYVNRGGRGTEAYRIAEEALSTPATPKEKP